MSTRRLRISIAMATYNGARYLGEQLESLAAQERLPDELVVCDDGSTDETLSILAQFAANAPFPVHIHRNERNLGFADNFFRAARLSQGAWIAFCDQDDVWLPNKLSDCAEALTSHPGANLVLQQAELCNANLKPRGRMFPDKIKPGIYGPNRQHGFWFWHGFLQTVAADWLQQLDHRHRPDEFNQARVQNHDRWACMIGNALGGVVVLERPVALHRRHEFALTGNYAKVPPGSKVAKSLLAGAEAYARSASVAEDAAAYLRRISGEVDREDWRARFRESAKMFDQLAQIGRMRAHLHAGNSIVSRFGVFARTCANRGYLGHPFVATGWGALLKDLAVVFGLGTANVAAWPVPNSAPDPASQ